MLRLMLLTAIVASTIPLGAAAQGVPDFAALQAALADAGVPLEVCAGAEVALTRALDLPDDELRALPKPGIAYEGQLHQDEAIIDGVVTVSAVIMLVYPGFMPASLAVLLGAQRGDLGSACALGTVLVALVLVAIVVRRNAVHTAAV